MNFEQARAEYERLRHGYENRTIGPEEYTRRIQELLVRDEGGAYWAIDGANGNWLRYDGSTWVPGQPPGLAPAAPAGTYTPPQQGQGYGRPQYGQPQPAPAPAYGYGQPQPQQFPPETAAPPAAAPKRRNRALIAGCAAATIVALLGCLVTSVLLARNGLGFLDTSTRIGDAATARGVNNKNEPSARVSEFSPNTPVYVTYVARNVKQGQTISVRLLRDGQPQSVQGGETAVTRDYSTLNGYFRYTPTQRGEYTAQLYLDGASAPSETVNFTVR